jgi:hypothetical protein
MKIGKLIAVLAVLCMLAAPAWAGNIPEFDAVGCDATNVFAATNEAQYGQTVAKNIGPTGPINLASAFSSEYFSQTAGQLFYDPCFGQYGMVSALTDAYNEAVYEWQIVLQMKPESDINLNIYDCVLKHNEFSPWWGDSSAETPGAEQTGRYRASWGQLMFVPSANPSVTVIAYPGEYATPGFTGGVTMDARTLPGLGLLAMDGQLYTSKAIWDEGLVLVLPETGSSNQSGQTTYNLKQGDKIYVKVQIPYNNTADIRYGADSVILKYIGITGTWYYGNPCLEQSVS